MNIKKEDVDAPEKRGRYTVVVVGCGRLGLSHACLFAEAGFKVVGVEVDPFVISMLRKGKTLFTEPQLKSLLRRHVKEGSLTVTSNFSEVASESDVILLAVPTLVDGKRRLDYSKVKRACKDVGIGLRSGSLVVSISVVGPGVTESLVKETLELSSGLKAGIDFGLAYSPVHVSSGQVLRGVVGYPRVVGAVNKLSLKVASLILGTIVKAGIVETSSIKTAEAVLLFQKVQRDVNLALANELALFCESAGIDYLEVQRVANTIPNCHLLIPTIAEKRVPKDPYILLEEAESLDAKLRLISLAREINEDMVTHIFHLVRDALRQCGKTIRRATVAVLGVSRSPNVKNPCGSSTKNLVDMLTKKGLKVKVYDPFFSSKELAEMGYQSEETLTKTVEGIDCLIIAVGHNRFKRLNLRKIKFMARMPAAIVDAGHVINPAKAEREGFVYRGLGRGVWTK